MILLWWSIAMLSVCLCLCVCVCLPICLFISICVCMCFCLSGCLCLRLAVCCFILCLSVCVCKSGCLSSVGVIGGWSEVVQVCSWTGTESTATVSGRLTQVNIHSFIDSSMVWFFALKQLLLSAHLSHRNSVRPSHRWISQKRCKLESPNLHRWLPGRL